MKIATAMRAVAASAAFGLSTLSLAGTITGVKADPASAVVGASVKVTVSGDNEGICALRVEYGNGDVDVTKMNAGKDDFPRSFAKSYNKAGTYTITAKGGREGSTFGCVGETKTTITIAEAPKPVAAPAAATATPVAGPACPEGYALNKASVNKKTGAYTCSAKKGAKKPDTAMACPAGTEYFANAKGSSLGCRKPAPAKK